MHHRLTTLIGALFSPPTRTRLTKRYPHRGRRLLGEQLECRYALSTLAGADLVPELPDPSLEPPALIATTSEEIPADMNSASSILPTDPLPPIPPVPPLDPMGGGSSNAQPQIVNFSITIDGIWCILQGSVVDDQDPTGQPVQLNGLIMASPTVAENDSFTWTFQLDASLHGTISASYQDMYGLISNTATVTI